MAFQFMHFTAYASKSSSPTKPSIGGILGEAMRAPGFAPHIANPRPPVVVFGHEPTAISMVLAKRIAGAKGVNGAPITVRTLALFTVVVSFPEDRETIALDRESVARYLEWRIKNIKYFQKKYGDALVSIIEHQDEKFLHLHVYVVPLVKDGVFAIETISKPHEMQLQVQREGGSWQQQRAAFTKEAKDLQDDYYREVGSQFDLDRYGPRRQRLSRAEILARNHQKNLDAQVLAAKREEEKQKRAEELDRINEKLKIFQEISKELSAALCEHGLQEIAREIINHKIQEIDGRYNMTGAFAI